MAKSRLRNFTACVFLTFLIGFGFVVSYMYEYNTRIKCKDGNFGKLQSVENTNENRPQKEEITKNDNIQGLVRDPVADLTGPRVARGFENNTGISEEEFQLHTESLNISEAIHNYAKKYWNSTRNRLRGFVIITTVDSNFIKLMENWRKSLKRLGLNYNVALICEDDVAYNYYIKRQTPHFKVLNNDEYEFTGKLERKKGNYQQLIKRRTVYVRNVLFSGTDVLLVDIDAVWLKDPVDIIRQSYQIYDLWVAQGHEPRVPCPCFLYMKAVPSVMRLAGQWVNRLSNKSLHIRQFESDQFALQHILKRSKDLRVCSLDKVRFPTGKEFFDPEWNRDNIDYVYIAHGNHLGRKIGKVEKLKEFGLWLLDS